jgi:CRP/FNR family cyclic AMP-dependent transcriptional regulator
MSQSPKAKLARVIFRPGQRLFKEGDIGQEAYIVEDGIVEVEVRRATDHVVVNTIERGGIVGEMALFDDLPRSASARAVSETVVLVVPRELLHERLAAADPVLQRVVLTLVDRLRTQTRINAAGRQH